jgi:hypothetical protein
VTTTTTITPATTTTTITPTTAMTVTTSTQWRTGARNATRFEHRGMFFYHTYLLVISTATNRETRDTTLKPEEEEMDRGSRHVSIQVCVSFFIIFLPY